MCIVGLAYKVHPNYPIAILANRDEWSHRESHTAHQWKDHTQITAGIDLQSGGTWLGITDSGRWCALCNDPRLQPPKKIISRGLIAKQFLTSQEPPLNFINQLEYDHYAGFFILLGDKQSAYYYSNVDNQVISLSQGLHTMSNAPIYTPWPKTKLLKKKLKHWINQYCEIHIGWQALQPNCQQKMIDAINQDNWNQYKKENIFIKGNNYRTTHSSIILISESSTLLLQKQFN